MRKEIVLSGYGGQGLLMAGVLLGEAIAVYEGKNVTQNQSYGVQARGGTSRSEVIVSDEEINYAEIEEPDILLAMSQSALNEYGPKVRKNALVIVDSAFVEDVSAVQNTDNIYRIPITEVSRERTGKPMLANVVALGALAKLSGIVSQGGMEQEIAKRAPEGTEDINMLALAGGIAEAEKLLK